MQALVIGVLALQGAFGKHAEMLRSLDVKVIEIRKPIDLVDCDALVIPGGESTTMLKQMQFIGFAPPFCEFAKSKPVFGTCAGLILMSHDIVADEMIPFNLLDITVERNAFGRQVESFQTEVEFTPKKSSEKNTQKLPAMFIRAPRILRTGSEVQILATYQGEPVLVQQGHHLGATFHPELTFNPAIHAHFIKICKSREGDDS
ncbi:MAG: pyridoxal 5'-phosphate synthase glutaminase subunit PdxT [Parachlamydiaceae bacterium]|nr:pyridoxal 5'-phosphate synthase glutaminase subunit PdxT [Parachlamydiaceae bacterium]